MASHHPSLSIHHRSSSINHLSSIIHHPSIGDHHPSPIIYHPEESRSGPPVRPPTWSRKKHVECSRFWGKFAQIMSRMFYGRFWLQNKDLGASLGAIEPVFRAGSVPIGPGVSQIAIFFSGDQGTGTRDQRPGGMREATRINRFSMIFIGLQDET